MTSTATSFPTALDTFTGCILGLAIGDALGFPAQVHSRRRIFEVFGPAGLTELVGVRDSRWPSWSRSTDFAHPAGTYSDDTQLARLVAEGLLEAGVGRGWSGPLAQLEDSLTPRLVRWCRGAWNNRGPTGTTLAGCARLEAGVPWRFAGVLDARSSNVVTRLVPLGLLLGADRDQLDPVARTCTQVTDGHPVALEAACGAAQLVALAAAHEPPERMYEELRRTCTTPELVSGLARLPGWLDAPAEQVLSRDGMGEGRTADEVLLGALWCFWRSPHDYRTTVLTAVHCDGDSDSLAGLAGAISGASLGEPAIPAAWRAQVEDGPGLGELARRLFEAATRETA